ncbi:MAG: 50S ribosomal protein L24 [Candidatus Paceibacterota bacterium]
MNSLHVKKGDSVIILTGKDRGKTGTIAKVLPKEGRVVVEGVNMIKKHTKQGIIDIPRPIDVSNVAKKAEKKTTTKSKK